VTEVRDRRWIAASPRDVWKVLGVVERYPDWCPWVRAVPTADGRLGLGVAYEARGAILAPPAGRSRWRVVEFDPPRRMVHRGEQVRLAASFDRVFELRSDGADGTWLMVAVRYRPALGLLGRVVDRAILRSVQARRLPAALDGIERVMAAAAG
jgi:hypothetical protein